MDGIDAGTFEVRSNGSADLSLEGTAGRLALDLSGSGDAEVAGLNAREAQVAVSGSGDVDVRADQRLDVDVDGSGDVRYHGDPAAHARGRRVRRPEPRGLKAGERKKPPPASVPAVVLRRRYA